MPEMFIRVRRCAAWLRPCGRVVILLILPVVSACSNNLGPLVPDAGPDSVSAEGCARACHDRECGDDGCGSICGTCDSGNQCQEGTCLSPIVAAACTGNAACNDHDPCTAFDRCYTGRCRGLPTVCDDGNPCTDDRCGADGCESEPNDEACDDGEPCTTNDQCGGGGCVGATIGCEDNNPCTLDACVHGDCVFPPANRPCEDGDTCTVDDRCTDGNCVSGERLCDDGDPCTIDRCVPGGGCEYEGGGCDDGSVCTGKEVCNRGDCQAGISLICDDEEICTTDSCHAVDGCIHGFVEGPCSDGIPCLFDQYCVGGMCGAGTKVVCDDGNPCTHDFCADAGGCTFSATNGASCDDQNPCTEVDTCHGHQCVGEGLGGCDDGNTCTIDGCVDGIGCAFTPRIGYCDDGNACTISDSCQGGVCVAGGPTPCVDLGECVDVTCDPSVGCQKLMLRTACDDGDGCTEDDHCSAGSCEGAFVTCDDNNQCTSDHCDVWAGCVFLKLSAACDDGDPCTIDDACIDGTCVSSSVETCNDDNPCTADYCAGQICHHDATEGPCDDGSACTENDECGAASCRGDAVVCHDGNPCLDWTCDPKIGCAQYPNLATCDDGDHCTQVDVCAGGECVGSDPLACEAETECTYQYCDPSSGCLGIVSDNGTPCVDGFACFEDGACLNGFCQGVWVQCDDGNPCTDDACDFDDGCVSNPRTGACDDGNACTQADSCVDGHCVGSAAVVCDDDNPCTTNGTCDNGNCIYELVDCTDGNPCTLDSCLLRNGCKNEPRTGGCDDGDPCTTNDECEDGMCMGGTPPFEICDGLDNDCDSLFDEGCSCDFEWRFASSESVALVGGGPSSLVAQSDGWEAATAAIEGADWIWNDAPTPNADDVVQFVIDVELPPNAQIQAATLAIAATGSVALWSNTETVRVHGEPDEPVVAVIELTAALQNGARQLTLEISHPGLVESTARSNPAGVRFSLDVFYDSVQANGCGENPE
ncbi:MAG: hypothetical protein ACI9OJ_001358 [Myxococcota bacterium]|jgi:hypothetical protein